MYLGRLIVLREDWEDAYNIIRYRGGIPRFIFIERLAAWDWDLRYVGTPITAVPVLKIDLVLPVFTNEDDLFYLVFREKTILTNDEITRIAQGYAINRDLPLADFVEEYAKRRIIEIIRIYPLNEILRGYKPVRAKWKYDVKGGKKFELGKEEKRDS